jgi:hypothetical protein
MSKLFAAFLGLMLGLRKLRDVVAGVLKGDEAANRAATVLDRQTVASSLG